MRWIAVLGAALCGWVGPALADLVVPGEEHCVVNVDPSDRLNLRKGPSAATGIVAAKRHGQCGIVVAGPCTGNWCPVEDGHSKGWAHRRYLSMVSPARYCVHAVHAQDRLNMRAWPSATSRILTDLAPNQCGISFLPYARGGWQKVRVDGYEGWVNRAYLSGQ
nr:SH3 domain-containing protein [Tianweitania sediminis]